MRKALLVAAALLMLGSSSTALGQEGLKDKRIVIIEGTILDMSPVIPPSPVVSPGMVSQYRLVKYKVDRVCRGEYRGGEMVIDHPILTGDELKDRKVGDKVYVGAWRFKNLEPHYSYKGIREDSEVIKEFYYGGNTVLANSNSCSYDEKEILFVKKP